MKAKQLIEKIREDWPVKVICFVIAIFFYIFYQISSLSKVTLNIPLTVDQKNGMLVASSYNPNVKVTVRGPSKELSALRDQDFSPYLDLNYVAKEGTFTFPVLIKMSESANLIDPLEVSVSPSEVTLTVEEEIADYVPISPLLNGKPAYGYEIKEILVSPKTIKVYGPRSMVQNCKRLQTKEIVIEGASVAMSKTVGIEKPGVFIRPSSEKDVTVTVNIQPAYTKKTFDAVNVTLKNVPENLELVGAEVSVDVTYRGKVIDLDKVQQNNLTAYADCSSISGPGEFQIPVTITPPYYLTVEESSKKTVTVVVSEKKDKHVESGEMSR